MADRPGEHKARESAAAVRDAAASLQSPESQQAIRAYLAADGDDDPRGLKDDDAPAPEGGQDPKPESADEPAKEPETDDDEPGSDYDPEDAAEYPDDDDEPPEKPPAQEPQEPTINEEKRQILERYKDDESRAEALLELERLKSGEPPKSPETEPEPGQQRFTPRPGQPPQTEDIRTILEEMSQADPSIQRAIDDLTQIRTRLTEDRAQFETQDKALQDLDREVRDLEAIHGHAQKRLERVPEDDIATRDSLTAEIQSVERDLNATRHKFQRAESERFRLERDNAERQQSYSAGVEELRLLGEQEYTDRGQQIQEQDERKTAYNAARKEKEDALPRVMKELKIPDGLVDEFRTDIGAMADRLSDEEAAAELAPGRIEGWMLKVGKTVKGKYDRYAQATVRTYIDNKKADADQPAPRNPRRPHDPKRDRPLTAREMDRQAGKQLKQRLSGSRA